MSFIRPPLFEFKRDITIRIEYGDPPVVYFTTQDGLTEQEREAASFFVEAMFPGPDVTCIIVDDALNAPGREKPKGK